MRQDFFSDRLKLWYLKFQLPIPSSIHNLFTCLFKKYLHKKEQVTITYTILDVKNYTKNWIQTWMEIEKLEDESLNNIIFFPVSTLKKFTITWIYFLEVLDHYYHLNTLIKIDISWWFPINFFGKLSKVYREEKIAYVDVFSSD